MDNLTEMMLFHHIVKFTQHGAAKGLCGVLNKDFANHVGIRSHV